MIPNRHWILNDESTSAIHSGDDETKENDQFEWSDFDFDFCFCFSEDDECLDSPSALV